VPEYKISIKTESDLRAAHEYAKELNKIVDLTKKTGGETQRWEKELAQLKTVLGGTTAAEVMRASSLEKAIKLTKELGMETRHLEVQLEASRRASGQGGKATDWAGHIEKARAGLPSTPPAPETFWQKASNRFGQVQDRYNEGFGKGGVVGGVMSIAGMMNPITVAGIVTGTAALKVASKGLQEYAASEKEVFKMNAALALRGQLTADYSEKLQELATSQQHATAIADEDWMSVITTGTKAGAGPENIEKFVKGVEDLAGVMGGDITTAAQMLGKAMQGNFTMLARWGIEVDKNATQAEKFDQVLQQVAARGAGQLRAGAEGLDGAFKRLKNAGSDLWENLGNGVNSIFMVDVFVNKLANGMSWLAEATFKPIAPAKGLKNAIDGIPEILEQTAAATQETGDGFKKLGDDLDRVKDKAELAKAAIDRAKGIQDDEAEARKRVELAQVKDDLASGRIGDAQAELRTAAIEQRYQRDALIRQNQADQSKMAANDSVINELHQADQVAEAILAKLKAELVPEDKIEAARGRHAELQSEEASIRKQIEEMQLKAASSSLGPMAGLASRQPELDRLNARLDEIAFLMGKEGKFVSSATVKNTRNKADIEEIEKARAEQELRNQAERARALDENAGISAQMASRNRVYSFDTHARAIETGTSLREIRNDPTSKEVKASLREIRRIQLEAAQLQKEFALEMLSVGIKSNEDYKRALEIVREIKSVQQKSNRGN
jgi:hypothetical protein